MSKKFKRDNNTVYVLEEGGCVHQKASASLVYF